MKTKIKIIFLLLMLSTGIWIIPQKAYSQGYVTYQAFYDDLSPYGIWIDVPTYGYVWMPNVDSGFIPYATNGYWVFTDDGWTWVSYYPWGWAPFHYGRWYTDAVYGPVWIPGYEWGPGWVTWRYSNDYYGWAAMEPGVSISVAYGSNYYPRYNHWTVVNGGYFGRRDISNYYYTTADNTMVINNSKVINNTRMDNTKCITYNGGPAKSDVEKHIGKTITPVTIKESNVPGQKLSKNQLQIYKPTVQKSVPAGTRIAPAKIANYKDVKTLAQRANGATLQTSLPKEQLVRTDGKWDVVKQQTSSYNKNENIKQQQQTTPNKKEEGITQQTNPYKKMNNRPNQPPQSLPFKNAGSERHPHFPY